MTYDLKKAAENAVFCASGTKNDRPCPSCWANLKRMVSPMPGLETSDEDKLDEHVGRVEAIQAKLDAQDTAAHPGYWCEGCGTVWNLEEAMLSHKCTVRTQDVYAGPTGNNGWAHTGECGPGCTCDNAKARARTQQGDSK